MQGREERASKDRHGEDEGGSHRHKGHEGQERRGYQGSPGSRPRQQDGHGTKLVIVESPSKARTIAGYLGQGYVVESSVGHIRDMPDSAAEIPAKYRGEPWARLGVNVDDNFQALYVVHSDKRQQVSKLKSLLKDADELLLATDEDREGEAIAWHLLEELKPTVPTSRMVFHEITPEAIARAIANPRQVDEGLVDAYQARRVLDRLYGYEVSPVLWKKVMPKLSAGRVQSVATRLIVDRERERIAFRAAAYSDLEAEFATKDHGKPNIDEPTSFTANLVTVDGRRVAQGRDFTSVGELRASSADVLHLDAAAAAALAERLDDASFSVASVERKPYRRSPYAPFRTTTLQQEASRKLGFSAKHTMSVAQRLYENGYITYMRTDSVTLSQTAISAARKQAAELYGASYVPDAPRIYASKVKNAQEAHEAIRPAGDSFRTPAQVARDRLSSDERRLYELIWQRTVASQMKDATGESVSVRVAGTSTAGERAEFGATGKVINFYGFLKAYVESTDDQTADRDDQERRLPPLAESDPLDVLRLAPAEHSTRPPARYTEASLVKELEDREIGRPSTYATIIGTILDRGYVFKKGTALVPSFLAFAVVTLLERHFGQLVDYEFTARMEDVLDEIARGEAERVPWLRRFYFGSDDGDRRPGPEVPGRRHQRHRRAGRQLVPAGRQRHRGPGRPVRPLPGAGRAAGERPRRHRAGRADRRKSRRAFQSAERRCASRHRPRYRSRGDRQGRPVRSVRHRATRRGRSGLGQAQVRVAAEVHGAGHGHAGRRAEAAEPAAGARRTGRRAGHRAERPVRAVREEGHGQPVAGVGGPAVHPDPGRGQGAVRPAQGPRPPHRRRGSAAARARRGPGHRQADGDQGRPVRPLRDRRRDQRVAAQGRRGRLGYRPAGGRVAG